MEALLNIGLDTSNHTHLGLDDVLPHFVEHILMVDKSKVVMGKTGEETAVLFVHGIEEDDIYDISEALGQDCIAAYDLQRCKGMLIGPEAERWGEFDPTLFTVM